MWVDGIMWLKHMIADVTKSYTDICGICRHEAEAWGLLHFLLHHKVDICGSEKKMSLQPVDSCSALLL